MIVVYLFAFIGVYISARFAFLVTRVAITGWKLGTAQYRLDQARKEAEDMALRLYIEKGDMSTLDGV